jgi:Protein of unknown function (DUF4236)
MGVRFRRRIRIFPGLWLNLSKSGVSTSVGVKGLMVNMGRTKTKTTVSLPGTGLSYSETAKESELSDVVIPAWFWLLLVLAALLALAW